MALGVSATLVQDDGTYASYAKLARRLTLRQRDPVKPPLTRQQIHIWFTRRERNGFPAPYAVQCASGKTRKMFRISEVEDWYRGYSPPSGGRPKKELMRNR